MKKRYLCQTTLTSPLVDVFWCQRRSNYWSSSGSELLELAFANRYFQWRLVVKLAGRTAKFHLWLQARRQDLAAGGGQKPDGGAKNRRGATFLNTVLDVCSNRGAKREIGGQRFQMGGRAPLPLAVFIISGVSCHSSSPNLIKLVIFSCPYWYIETFTSVQWNQTLKRKHKHKRIKPVPSKVWRITTAINAAKAIVEPSTTCTLSLEHSARLMRLYC